MHTSSPFSLLSLPRSSARDYLVAIWPREVGDLGLPSPGMAHSPSLVGVVLLPNPSTPLGSRLSAPGFSPIYQPQSWALKPETLLADKGAAAVGGPWVPAQVCGDYLGGLIRVPCPWLGC